MRNQQLPWWIALPISIVFGILLVISIPEVKAYFEQLISVVLAVILLGVIVGIIILGIIWFINKESTYSFY